MEAQIQGHMEHSSDVFADGKVTTTGGNFGLNLGLGGSGTGLGGGISSSNADINQSTYSYNKADTFADNVQETLAEVKGFITKYSNSEDRAYTKSMDRTAQEIKTAQKTYTESETKLHSAKLAYEKARTDLSSVKVDGTTDLINRQNASNIGGKYDSIDQTATSHLQAGQGKNSLDLDSALDGSRILKDNYPEKDYQDYLNRAKEESGVNIKSNYEFSRGEVVQRDMENLGTQALQEYTKMPHQNYARSQKATELGAEVRSPNSSNANRNSGVQKLNEDSNNKSTATNVGKRILNSAENGDYAPDFAIEATTDAMEYLDKKTAEIGNKVRNNETVKGVVGRVSGGVGSVMTGIFGDPEKHKDE